MIGIRGWGSLLVVTLFTGACGGPQGDADADGRDMRLAVFDSLLADLAGPQAEDLSDGQRWRLMASTATGLPPTSYRLADLPEPEALGANLQQVYCVQCHGISSPKMHTTEEWPVLIRRMVMRARTLRDRLGGTRIEDQVDEMLIAGLQSANIPTAEEQDSLIAYFTRHALPAAAPGEIDDSPDAQLYVEYCSLCHEVPSPYAHGPDGAKALVYRMGALMEMLGMEPPDEAQKQRIVDYLQRVGQ